MSSVSIQSLQVHLGSQTVLQNLELQVREGEFLVLLGPSGCGKSTLLHAIAGLLDVQDGRIEIGGSDVTWADPKDRGIGMVFQSYALYPTMNVERNLSFGLRIGGVDRREIERRVQRAAAMLQLGELLKRKPAQLSGGQRQRVAIGRALVREAKVFLFDEPLSNLDAKLRAELRRELKQLHREIGSTMIYVTHDQVEAMTLATRVAVMRGGCIQQIDTPAEVYARPANLFVAGFLGSPPMNFIEGRLGTDADGRPVFMAAGLAVPLATYRFGGPPEIGRSVVLGVRPEHLSLQGSGPAGGTATVSLVEPMGSHQIVWLSFEGRQPLALSVPVGSEPPPGSAVSFHVDAERISLFDPQSEHRL
ncbi:ABC transporter ATP-binding protein [Aquabacterium sp. A7-Y]|uniref:ABC transporter ATP-binding protein n=1 Tax=Aquabacterium sp. A7-Y TaxID=1349605 RepID=UPI00223E0210|nr:ABC transporter ATP-binding protein [Aquabacterium sp. A7-Y]MCW7537925.1 ABC transporter ATP-binding protein [Aquabacterium sp. A7-Y]